MLEVISPPAAELVTLPEVYDHLRLGVGLTSHVDDARLTRLIRSARQQIETYTRRSLIAQQLRYTVDSTRFGWSYCSSGWGVGDLPRPILLSVDAVQYFDAANVQRSVDSSSYRVIGLGAQMGGRLEFVSGYSAPPTFVRSDARSVIYTAGYPPGTGGAAAADDLRANVPEPIRDAALLMIDLAYNARLPAEEVMLNDRIDSMLATYRVPLA